mmetsp:Transcript_24214/g.35208  ORF Transcript_24214/g.35208 Transcript_24214/m.35208 type:complete len:617 (-) Transcript_24214:387-2237(-)
MAYGAIIKDSAVGSKNDSAVGNLQSRKSSFVKICLLTACVLLGLFGTYHISNGSNLSISTLMNFAEPGVAGQGRFPVEFDYYESNMYDLDVVTDALAELETDEERAMCTFPGGANLEVYFNEKKFNSQGIYGSNGYTVFNLDCRNFEGMDVIAWILILDMHGQIIAAQHEVVRSEHVSMFNTSTVMYSTVGGKGAYLWNWHTGALEREKFTPDAHTIAYIHSSDTFFGLLNDKEARLHHSPSVATEYDHEHGDILWSFPPPVENAHVNFLSLLGDGLYLSMRSAHALFNVNRRTKEIEWIIGGQVGTIDILDYEGVQWPAGDKHTPWSFQHKFQHLDEKYFSLYDNHVDSHREFIDGWNSRMVVLEYDDHTNMVREKWVHDTGDQSTIYGSADLMPSGNILGNSYPQFVYPDDPDHRCHVNVWEITGDDEIVWRVCVRGSNTWDPSDTVSPFRKSVVDGEQPVGWLIYNSDRFYDSPVIKEPCMIRSGHQILRLALFNTVRTQEDMPGVVRMYGTESKELMFQKEFYFHKSFFPRYVHLPTLAAGVRLTEPAVLVVENNWGDKTVLELGDQLTRIGKCSETEPDWMFRPFMGTEAHDYEAMYSTPCQTHDSWNVCP